MWWSSDARRCAVHASPAQADRGASRREGRIKRCVDHDHGRLWMWHYPSLINAFLLFRNMFPFYAWAIAQLLLIHRPSSGWKASRGDADHKSRLGSLRLCCSSLGRKLPGGFCRAGKCWNGLLWSTEVSEEWEVGRGAGFSQELRGETRLPAVWWTLHLRYAQPRQVLQAALVLPLGLVSL